MSSEDRRCAFYFARDGLYATRRTYLEMIQRYDAAAAGAYRNENRTMGRVWAQAAQDARRVRENLYTIEGCT